MVMNALDNLKARTHVNRMCLAAGVPLIESGTGFFSSDFDFLIQFVEMKNDIQSFDQI